MTDKPRRKTRTPKAPETLLVRNDFRNHPGLLEYLEQQATGHVRTPAQEIVHRLLVAFNLDKRRGVKGILGTEE